MAYSTTTSPKSWAPDQIATYDPSDVVPEAILMQATTFVGTVEGDAPAIRAAYVSDDPDAAFVDEGADIALSDGVLAEVVVMTRKLAILTKVSREQITQPGAADRIATSMRRSITSAANNALLGNAADPTGLFNTPGLQTAGDLGGTANANTFAMADAVGAIEAEGGTASHVIAHPLDWAALAKIPVSSGSAQSVLTDAHAAPERTLAGLPVLVSRAAPQGKVLVLDQSEVAAAYGAVSLARSDDAYFSSDTVGVRVTWRIGWTVVRPERLRLLTVAAD